MRARREKMKRLSQVLSILLMGLLMSVFVSSPAKAIIEWNTPTQLTNNNVDDYNPSISGDGSKIAFQSDIGGDDELFIPNDKIFLVNFDGSDLTQLTSNTSDYNWPCISIDGLRIAFQSYVNLDYEIFVISSELQEYNLNVSVTGSGFTSPSAGSHSFKEGDEVAVYASASNGWNFSHWLLDSAEVGDANPYTVTMDSDHSLTAMFTGLLPDITPPIGSIVING
jgi:hypothetical protein